MFFSAAVVLSLASLINAQASLDIAAIEAHFSGAGIVPSLLQSFNPSAILDVSFSGVGSLQPGQALNKNQVAPTPSLSVTPANNSVSLNGNFTLVMADASVVGTDQSKGQTRHWLVNGVTLTGSSPKNVSTDAGLAVTQYAGPAPPQGEGPHRYVLLLLPQPANFQPPQDLSTANVGVSVFNLNQYISSTNLGQPVAGMYFTVAEGTTTAQLSSTQPVNSATLVAASASASGTQTSKASSSTSTSSSTNTDGAISTFVSAPLALLASVFGLMML